MAKQKRLSRKQPAGKPRDSQKQKSGNATYPEAGSRMPAIIWGLFLVRWFIPTEGTVEGDTLWLTSLTLAAAAGFFWWKSRVSLDRLRFEKIDFAVWLLCGAHVLSALVVILTEGNKRAAANMLWEWLAVAVTFSLLRQTITRQSRPRFLQTVAAVTIALACYGIWQPTFWYPANLREYQELKAEMAAVESSTEMPTQERINRMRELRAEFVSQGIPLSGPALELFERRLRDSKEPLGFFALTNSFASLMAISLVLLTGTLVSVLLPGQSDKSLPSPDAPDNRKLIALLAIAMLLVTYCLVLTKSRSAWGGTAVGLVALIGLFVVRSKSGAILRKLLPILAVSLVAVSLLTGIAIATEALDIEVLTEASTSLSYRLEYWTSSWNVILDHPLLGTGPGNFRSHYLRHKLPQSSEEISDPHQFILDVTANAGVVGLFGLLALLGMIAWLSWQLCRQFDEEPTPDSHTPETSDQLGQISIRSAIAWTAGITIAGEWLFSGALSWSVLSVCVLAAAVNSLINLAANAGRNSAQSENGLYVPAVAVVAAIVTLFVHLSAAGGIAMPAIVGSVLALVAVLNADSAVSSSGHSTENSTSNDNSNAGNSSVETNERVQVGTCLAAALLSGIAAVGCTTTAFSPVVRATSLLQLGDYEAINGQAARQVVSVYKEAAKADPLSPEPHIHLSQFYLHHWKMTRDETYFDQAIKAAEQARSLSPRSPQVAHELGFAWLVRAQTSPDDDKTAITEAVAQLQNALATYPTNPTWTAETAQALALAGNSTQAATMAQQALKLDKINRAAGHVDRYLPDELLTEIEQLANTQ